MLFAPTALKAHPEKPLQNPSLIPKLSGRALPTRKQKITPVKHAQS
jgi:hypothetical protein